MDKIKFWCMNSLTMAWSYVLATVSIILEQLDNIADVVASQELKDQITATVGNTKVLGEILLTISIITMITRLRSIRKKTNV